NMYAIGGNIEAATVSGVSVIKYLLIVYTLAGLLYGFAGVLEAGRVGSATNNTGNMYELDAIAACVVGGVSTSGGIGSVSGIVTGVLIFQIINYGLVFIELSPYLQFIVKGLIIVSAVAIDIRKYVRQS
ncbi:MAG: beta-methylgalactoside transporter, partial [Trichodesmium sp. St2_bin2_1]|nr:beta-methylgalactoside transporter [Trichodesmium sp. St2_bin2_1]